MTQETRTTLKAGWVTNITDGGANTAAEVRAELDDIADSAYILSTDSPSDIGLGSTDSPTFDTLNLNAATNHIVLNAGGSNTATITTSTLGSDRTYTFPNATGTVSLVGNTANFSNKTLNNTNTLNIKDTNFTLEDDADATKILAFQLSSITSGNTRTLTVQDVSGTIYTTGGIAVAVADGGTGSSDAAAARIALGLQIGVNVQAYSAVLDGTTASYTSAEETKLSGIEAGADVTDSASIEAAGAKLQGKETLWLPANAMTPSETNGADPAVLETSSNNLNVDVLDFDASTDEHAWFNIAFPKSWDKGTITYQVFWTATAGSGTVEWNLSSVALGNSAPLDEPGGTTIAVTDTVLTTEDLHVTSESSNLTISMGPSNDEVCFFDFSRDVSGDSLGEDARLIGIKIYYTTDAGDDT